MRGFFSALVVAFVAFRIAHGLPEEMRTSSFFSRRDDAKLLFHLFHRPGSDLFIRGYDGYGVTPKDKESAGQAVPPTEPTEPASDWDEAKRILEALLAESPDSMRMSKRGKRSAKLLFHLFHRPGSDMFIRGYDRYGTTPQTAKANEASSDWDEAQRILDELLAEGTKKRSPSAKEKSWNLY